MSDAFKLAALWWVGITSWLFLEALHSIAFGQSVSGGPSVHWLLVQGAEGVFCTLVLWLLSALAHLIARKRSRAAA